MWRKYTYSSAMSALCSLRTGTLPLGHPQTLTVYIHGKCLMVTWQLRVILDRISNSCDVYEKG